MKVNKSIYTNKTVKALISKTNWNKAMWEVTAMCRICKYVDTLMSGLEWDHERQMARQPLDTTPTQIVCGKFVDFPVLLLICLFVFVFVT